jgi:5,10-methylene-tetrahydrofolate dehydrogenase/methenyl tetrahydrofolate cyclohydrolase
MFFGYVGVETFGKHAVVCGRSKNVGMPIAMLLHADGLGEYKQMYLLVETAFIMLPCEFCCVCVSSNVDQT